MMDLPWPPLLAPEMSTIPRIVPVARPVYPQHVVCYQRYMMIEPKPSLNIWHVVCSGGYYTLSKSRPGVQNKYYGY